jgi:acetyl-CoA C-acetyltransferase
MVYYPPNTPVIVSAARTPIAKFMGAFREVPAVTLGATAIQAAVMRAAVELDEVDYVFMGQVLQAGQGQNPARQAAVKAGLPMNVPAVTLNKVCLASLNAIAQAAQMIRCGEGQVAVAGGMESMTRAPYVATPMYQGGELRVAPCSTGPLTFQDSMVVDGLWCAFDDMVMGEGAETVHAREGITRLEQDEWAAESQRRAAAARDSCRFVPELVQVDAPDAAAPVTLHTQAVEPRGTRDGLGARAEPDHRAAALTADECIRPDTSVERLGQLPPAFGEGGGITAGNASQLSDGAAAVVVMSNERAQQENREILARIIGHSMVAGPDASLHVQPVNAVRRLLKSSGHELGDIALFEINEAFAGVAVYATRELHLNHSCVNVNGGAVALGHPLGCTGARLVVTLVHELRRRGGGLGVATLCGGGGQGEALLLEAG